ncbi:unnamed protein product [Mesocestoides corti]|uniref:DUF5741 domain-containing protein n=1 Tax=Mesocestoides corti TaxID=53468 RepID=A0A0R3UBA2_MESCO|nr:unnamed protein product [Mesocestoides corti]
MPTGWRDSLEQEVMVMADVEVLECLVGDFKAACCAGGAKREEEEEEEEESRVERVTAVCEAKLVGQKAQLEGRLNERVMTHEMTMRDVEAKHASLLVSVVGVRCLSGCLQLTAEERSERLEGDLAAVRMTVAEAQRKEAKRAEEGRNSWRSPALGLEEKARNYPELSVAVLDLGSRLHKRAELLESSTNEKRRLRRIVHEDERCAKVFLEELERLRRQMVEKNGAIKKLEVVARALHVRQVGARPCDDAT